MRLTLILLAGLLGCVRDKTPDQVPGSGVRSAAVGQTASPSPSGLSGAYKYDYPGDSPSLPEDSYLVGDPATGRVWFYGTSDEFDHAREGYQPAFFVQEVIDLYVQGDSVRFWLSVPDRRYFVAPVPLEYRSSASVPLARADTSTYGAISTDPEVYGGRIVGDTIVLRSNVGVRRFIRIR
jgi:hypothetical protein